jgi:vesicle transport through interaction with t-SNAREs 1
MSQLESSNGNVGKNPLIFFVSFIFHGNKSVCDNLLAKDIVVTQTVEIEGELSEAEGYVKAMDVEFKMLSANEKRNCQQKVTDYKSSLRQMQSDFSGAKFKAESLALKGGPNARNKIMTASQKLDSSTATLEQSRNILNQTEQIGDTIIMDLESQKETLVDAREKVKETKRFTVDAKQILRIMSNRALMHKACVMLTIVLLFGAIIGIGYYGIVAK